MSTPRKIIVAVHGMGDQTAFDFVQEIVKQFCKHFSQPATASLGRLDSDIRSSRGAFALTPPLDPQLPLDISFTEVYWAGIAREVETKGYRLEDTRHWARTIVERLKQHHTTGKLLEPQDYDLIKLSLQDAINAISVAELFMTIFKHAGAYKPKLEHVLTNYLGDVQLVAEFELIRKLFLDTFDNAMQAVYSNDPGAEIHIIAHSEGTVVSFLALLRALQKRSGSGPYAAKSWLDNVRGFITLGSPIDKHLVLWPELWQEFEFHGKKPETGRILWHNYYDFGDPVGFKLDTTRKWLDSIRCSDFDFPAINDFGFTRSYLPGEAHVDYLTDTELFGHMINTVIDPRPGIPAPASRSMAVFLGLVLPYFAAFLLLLAGVYLLYTSVDISACFDESSQDIIRNSALIALQLSGITVLSRVVRLSRRPELRAGAGLLFLGATYLFIHCLTPGAKQNISSAFSGLFADDHADLLLTGVAAFIAGCGLFSRKYSLKPLLFPGFFAIAWVVGSILLSCKEVQAVGTLISTVVVFFCLWWLSASIFDLSFIWHAYIRNNRAVDKLHEVFVAGLAKK